MEKKDLKIVFLGTPDFAVESLRRLVEGGYNIVGVVTMPDKIAGRGHKMFQSPVKQFALEHGLKLMQPTNLKDAAFVEELRELKADLQIVIAFRMLPEVVWSMPPMGTFNLHASLLPKYRGAAPINWAVINGDTETGVTTFFLKHEIDTGDIIQQRKIAISRTDNVGDVHDRLMMLGADMVIETVDAILDGSVKPISQEQLCNKGIVATAAPKIFKETCRVDWTKSGEQIYNFVRGLSPYPAAWTEMSNDKETHSFKIFQTGEPDVTKKLAPGELMYGDSKHLYIGCGDGAIEILSLQLSGKKRMSASDFMRGFNLCGYKCV